MITLKDMKVYGQNLRIVSNKHLINIIIKTFAKRNKIHIDSATSLAILAKGLS